MALVDVTREVESYDPIICSGCGQPAAVSTRIGRTIACPCGVEHTVKALVVASHGDCVAPDWAAKKAAMDRAVRAAPAKAAT
jgi:hypothetical protein